MTIICEYCGKENSDVAKYCYNCGSQIVKKIGYYDAFLSYRREGGSETARLIKMSVENMGNKNLFLDVDELRTGRFDEKLLDMIKKSDNFILILTPGSLDRCNNPDDWFRIEISHALKSGKNIIPIIKDGFVFPNKNF